MTRYFRAIAKPAPAARRWLTLAALLAFFLQNLAVQTHIHPADLAPLAKLASVHAATPPAAPKSQDPVDQCRLCQEIVHAGVAITPSASLLASPQLAVLAVFAAPPIARAQSAPAFAWQSRAPPQR